MYARARHHVRPSGFLCLDASFASDFVRLSRRIPLCRARRESLLHPRRDILVGRLEHPPHAADIGIGFVYGGFSTAGVKRRMMLNMRFE